MSLLFTAIFSEAFLQAVCRTLVHSLWQGIIAAVIAALIISLTKRSAAAVRYNLLVAVLCVFVVSISVTAYMELQPGERENSIAITPALDGKPSLPIHFGASETADADGAREQNLLNGVIAFCNENASLIVLVWFLFFLIKCSQLVVGLQHIQRLRHRQNREPEPCWKDRLKELAQKTGVSNTILLLESELVKIPAAIGFLKPVILVPAGLLSNLPPAQVEAILVHELAHIRRRDFLVNLLQSVIETVFFFNPAITWISSLVRQEREACCDDMVLAHIPLKSSYLQALVSFQEIHLDSKTGVLALTGNKQYLFNRVRRMLTLENKKLNLMEKTVLLFSIIGMTAFGFITKQSKQDPLPAKESKTEMVKPVKEERPAMVQMPAIKKPVLSEKKSVAPALPKQAMDTVPKVTEVQKAKRSFPSISSSTNNDGKTVVTQVEAVDDSGKVYRVKKVDGQIAEIRVNGSAVPAGQYGEYNEVIRQIDETQQQRIRKKKENLELKKKDMDLKQKEAKEKRELSKVKQKERNEKMKERNEIARKQNLKRAEDRKLLAKKNELKKRDYDKKRVEVLRKQKAVAAGKKSDNDVTRIIADLNGRNLVADSDNLSFSLTDKELVVNGKKQPAEVHQQFKDKYIQNSGDRFKYSKHGSTTNITINRD